MHSYACSLVHNELSCWGLKKLFVFTTCLSVRTYALLQSLQLEMTCSRQCMHNKLVHLLLQWLLKGRPVLLILKRSGHICRIQHGHWQHSTKTGAPVTLQLLACLMAATSINSVSVGHTTRLLPKPYKNAGQPLHKHSLIKS
jgi:hypothetical protein